MATPSDDTKTTVAKKAAKKTPVSKAASKTASKTTASKTTASKTTASKTASKTAKKAAPAKTAAKKAASKGASSAASNKPLNFDFSDRVEVESSAKKPSQNTSANDGLDKAKEHAGRAFDEIATAAVVGLDHVSKKLDAAAVIAKREGKAALAKGEKWVQEHPVAASVAGSAVVGTATAALKKLFKR